MKSISNYLSRLTISDFGVIVSGAIFTATLFTFIYRIYFHKPTALATQATPEAQVAVDSTPKPTPAPVAESTPVQSEPVTTKPAEEPAQVQSEPVNEPTKEPVAKAAEEPVAKPSLVQSTPVQTESIDEKVLEEEAQKEVIRRLDMDSWVYVVRQTYPEDGAILVHKNSIKKLANSVIVYLSLSFPSDRN